MSLKSVDQKLLLLQGLIDTKQVSDWENGFLKSVVPTSLARYKLGQHSFLTDNQLDKIDQIYDRHFA